MAVFDADFSPCTDFVYQTVYHMERDPQLGFVQVGAGLHAGGSWIVKLTQSHPLHSRRPGLYGRILDPQ